MFSRTLSILTLVALSTASTAWGQDTGTTDREKIIDVTELSEAMRRATEPVSERMKTSRLDQRFTEVKELLKQRDVDKEELLRALQDLNEAMQSFVSEWDEVTNPLWEAQDTVAQTVDRVRATMAGGFGNEENEKFRQVLANYDQRLDTLAQQTLAERDPIRQERLKRVYANVLSLRNLTDRVTHLNISPAAEAMHLKIVRALTGLQEQLTMATYEVERMRVVLSGLSEFVGNYVLILGGLVEAEKLAQFWSEWNEGDSGLGTIFGDVDSLVGSTEEFVTLMDSVVSDLADSIETETAKIAVTVDGPTDVNNDDVEADMLRRTGRAGK